MHLNPIMWWQKLQRREKRLLLYLVLLLGLVGWKVIPRPWKPTLTIETAHYSIASTATREQTELVARTVEILYTAYSNQFGALPGFRREHPRLKLLLYKDRAEFRRINPGAGWAEAFYRKPYCRAYYAADDVNSYHWMLHEAVHQLNFEVANLNLEHWLEEGLATYLSTSRIQREQLAIGRLDVNTYPVWWLDEMATASSLSSNLANASVIPLQAIITDRGGPSMDKNVNLYYLHWWTLTHHIFENARYRGATLKLLERGGDLKAFEELVGPVDTIQAEWHDHVRKLKQAVAGNDLRFFRTGHVPIEAR